MRGRWWSQAVVVFALALLAGCSGDGADPPKTDAPTTITVRSPAFADGAVIPTRYTCDGAEVSPPLRWEGLPADAAAAALVVDDPDAPDGTYVHWVVADIPPTVGSVAEGEVPGGAPQARTSAGDPGYAGPCPPRGSHRYRFTVYALDQRLGISQGADMQDTLDAIGEHAVAQGRLVGRYAR